jgi:GDPmannose 4,6-dehydratase
VDFLLADATKSREKLGWEPHIHFRQLVRIMVDADLELFGLDSPGEGRQILGQMEKGWHRWEHQVVSMEH